jgi:Soluble lytic murein transglycosylase and related regulatory proteins (some contain LysM/invasin domains)
MTKIRYAALLISLCTALSLASAKEAETAISLSAVSQEVTGSSAPSEVSTGGSQTTTPSPEERTIEAPEELPDAALEENLQTPDLSQLQPEELSIEEQAKNLQYGIPMPWGHELFEKYRQYYLSDGGRKILLATMQRAAPFMDYIQSKVAEYGVPQELAYLPVIESSFSPFAVSRSGATGIWQFMRNSIVGYGMSITEWVDDRRDFMKSTDAALNKLIDNYNDLKDWPLAIAAYNAGLGALRRAVNATGGDTDFWNIYEKGLVSRQALDYVPKFLAVASILLYPELYGLELPSSSIKWEAIPLDRQVDIKLLAAKAEIPLDTLKLGNAELHYTITPPDEYAPPENPCRKIRTGESDPLRPKRPARALRNLQSQTRRHANSHFEALRNLHIDDRQSEHRPQSRPPQNRADPNDPALAPAFESFDELQCEQRICQRTEHFAYRPERRYPLWHCAALRHDCAENRESEWHFCKFGAADRAETEGADPTLKPRDFSCGCALH